MKFLYLALILSITRVQAVAQEENFNFMFVVEPQHTYKSLKFNITIPDCYYFSQYSNILSERKSFIYNQEEFILNQNLSKEEFLEKFKNFYNHTTHVLDTYIQCLESHYQEVLQKTNAEEMLLNAKNSIEKHDFAKKNPDKTFQEHKNIFVKAIEELSSEYALLINSFIVNQLQSRV